MSRWAAGLTAALLLAGAPEGAVAQSAHAQDTHGHRFRTEFPRHQRVWAGGGYAWGANAPTWGAGLQTAFAWEFPAEEVWWRLQNDVSVAAAGDGFVLRPWEGHYQRHDQSSFILVPGDIDLRLPAPFDVALDFRAGELTFDANMEVTRIRILHAELGMDFLRDPSYRHRLVISVVPEFERDLLAGDYRVSPFTVAALRYGWASATGRTEVWGRAEAGYAARLDGDAMAWEPHWRVEAAAEWTVLAINDEPISVVGSAALGPQTWSASLGLRASLVFF